MTETYFTSDTHFGHKNIVRLGNGRPFADIQEHDEALIRNWNERVRPGDKIYHLGDFAMDSLERIEQVLRRLNGQKFHVRGNHDKVLKGKILEHFVWSRDYAKLKFLDEDSSSPSGHQTVILSHYPMEIWDRRHYGSWHLHGHCHGSLKLDKQQITRFDVGVDCWDYSPVSYQEIKENIYKREEEKAWSLDFRDHHDPKKRRTSPLR